jgi:hypothetical protein
VAEGYNLEPVRSVYEYPPVALLHVPESSAVFFTDGCKGETGTGFGVYQLDDAVTSVFCCGNNVVSSHQNCRQFLWPWSKSEITNLVNLLFYRTA